MKYIITRASDWNDKQPCDNAIQEDVLCIDERTVDDPMKNPHIGEKWYSDFGYFNHRVENGHIKRDYYRKVWTMEINTLEELHKFMEKEGEIIIGLDYWGSKLPHITIYDDYVE